MRPPARLLALALLAVAARPAGAAEPADLDLEIRHTVISLGADGVTRTSEFRERVHRRQDLVWVERVRPPAAHRPEAHAAGGEEHRHADLSVAARWITRAPDGLRLRLVVADEKLVLEVPPADRASVGFDGDWVTSSRFLRPEVLAAMTRPAEPAPAGARWYERRTPEGTLRILWDEAASYPRRVESRSADGAVVKTSVAERRPAPAAGPWTRLAGYAAKEYSDTLD